MRRYYCRDCKKPRQKDYRKKWNAENKEYRRQKKAEYRAKDPEKFRSKRRQWYHRKKTDLSFALGRRLNQAKLRSSRRGIDCTVTVEELVAIYHKQGGRCPISGRTLEFGGPPGNPNLLSIDRIDAKAGYITENVRLVTWAVNSAMGVWGEDALNRLCDDIIATRETRIANLG